MKCANNSNNNNNTANRKPLAVIKPNKEPPLESISCQSGAIVKPTSSNNNNRHFIAVSTENPSLSLKKSSNRPRSVTASVFCPVSDLQIPPTRPQAVTSSLFTSSISSRSTTKPQSITSRLFAPRTGDMNSKPLLKYLDEGNTDLTSKYKNVFFYKQIKYWHKFFSTVFWLKNRTYYSPISLYSGLQHAGPHGPLRLILNHTRDAWGR